MWITYIISIFIVTLHQIKHAIRCGGIGAQSGRVKVLVASMYY